MRKKKIFLIIIASFAILVCSFGATYAYLHVKERTVNEFTVGENIIELHEDYEPPEKLEPGISFTKKPYVENTGNVPCFVRMRADFSNSKAEEFCELNINDEYWEKNTTDGYYYYKYLLEPNTNKETESKSETKPLFTTVKIKQVKDDGSDYTVNDMVDFDILIYAESCHCKEHGGNCSDNEYKTVWDKNTGDTDQE